MDTLLIDDTSYETHLTEKYRGREPWKPRDPKRVSAFLPGTICDVRVAPGRRVKAGDTLYVFEAMKMLNTVVAHEDGIVKNVHISAGMMVAKGQLLLEFQ